MIREHLAAVASARWSHRKHLGSSDMALEACVYRWIRQRSLTLVELSDKLVGGRSCYCRLRKHLSEHVCEVIARAGSGSMCVGCLSHVRQCEQPR